MESLNLQLFLLINAPAHPDPLTLALAKGLAEGVIWLVPLFLTVGWLWGTEQHRHSMLEATAAGLGALALNQMIALVWQHPRPFMLGLGHTYLLHAPDSSFPSDHLTLLWSVAFSLCYHRSFRYLGMLLALLGLPVAWSRVYLGVHFPLDMLGAVVTAEISSWTLRRAAPLLLFYCYQPLQTVYHNLTGPLIRRGWIAE
ncbi:undecaprenyl-diphosphatase [Trichlorobacter lovleyi]|uniref:undecaprenyl-diphosphatase n=1 Tax=Trichlorobacter lovleyi TaxID=313985 RepID=UPI00223EAA2F|nr:undecaprenyl-diphosphatase [Trichlorobacter lovleyi]QOX80209.1 undecaprenyl-diphosphatase [Trichlorobacter lovleyi]